MEGVTFVDLYAEYPRFEIDVDREQARLLAHDVIVFQNPLFWYSTPAILKEWQDLFWNTVSPTVLAGMRWRESFSLAPLLPVAPIRRTDPRVTNYRYDQARESSAPSDFHGPSRAHRTPPQVWCFTGHSTLSPANLIPGCQSVKKKRELFPGLPPASPSSLALPPRAPGPNPHPGSGMLTRFPFEARRGRRSDCAFQRDLSLLLGSTNPCPTAVHMEPFSTSVFKVLV